MRKRLSRLKKEHTKEFQVSYETLLFMAKVKEYGYGNSEAIKCANFAWYLLEEEDKYIPIISDIQHILRRL